MGAVTFSLDLRLAQSLKECLALDYFVETGTFEGATLETVKEIFKECYSVELSEVAANVAKSKFSSFPNVHIECGQSPDFLRKLQPTLEKESVLYWLDAHWCEGVNTAGKFSQCPLLEELGAIKRLNSESVVVIDDARLFLAPPLAPHEVSQWPRLQQILESLKHISDQHELMVLNDVILYFPTRLSEHLTQFANQKGTDWLAVSHSANLEATLRNTISELHSVNALAQTELRTAMQMLQETSGSTQSQLQNSMQKLHEGAKLAQTQLRAAQQKEKLSKEKLKAKLQAAKKEIEKLKAARGKKPRWWQIWSKPADHISLPQQVIDPIPKPALEQPKAPEPEEIPKNAYTDIGLLPLDRPISVIFDIGANEGQTMFQLARNFQDANIFSFEPFPAAFEKLCQNAASLPNVKTHQIALGERNGDCTLFLSHASVTNSLLPTAATAADYSPPGWTEPVGTMTVPISTLDVFCQANQLVEIDLLKIDAQGYEMNILQGAEKLLESGNIRFIYLELIFVPLYEGQASFELIYGFLQKHDFRLVDLYEKNAGLNGTLHWCNALFRLELGTAGVLPSTIKRATSEDQGTR